MRTIGIIFVTIAALGAAASAATTTDLRVRHVPPSQAAPTQALRLEADVDHGWEAPLELRYRSIGDDAWQSVRFQRQTEDQYVAVVPAGAMAPPGIEYFLVSVDEGTERPHFASAADPHPVRIYQGADDRRRERELALYGDRRARVQLRADHVDFGSRELGGKTIADRYLRVDADFTYRVLSLPLHSLRFGYTRLLGDTPGEGTCAPDQTEEQCTFEAGFKVGGWFELRFAFAEGVQVDTRGMVIATPEGFNVGGRGEVRLGTEDATHVAVGGELVADVGSAGFFRLGWGTVPGFPMAATVELTDFPASHRPTAVRLLYDVAHPFEGGFRIGVRAGYQARDFRTGGLSLGLATTMDF